MLSGNGLAQLIPFAIAPILSRIYSPSDFGGFSNFMAVLGIFIIVSCGRFDVAIMLPKLKEEAIDVIRKGLQFLKWTVLASLLTGLFFAQQISEVFDSPEIKNYLILLPFFVILYGLYSMGYNWLNRNSRYKLLASSKLLLTIVIGAVNLILGYMGAGVSGLIMANMLGMASVLFLFRKSLIEVYQGVKERKGMSLTEVEEKYKDFPRINLLHAFFDVANQQFLFNLIFTGLFGVVSMGFYALSYRYIRGPMTIITGSVSQVFFQEASRSSSEGDGFSKIFLKTLSITMVFALPFFIILFFFAPELFAFVFGEEWYDAGIYAQALSPALAMQFLVSPVSHSPIIGNRQKLSFVLNLGGQLMALGILWYVGSYLMLGAEVSLQAYSLFLCLLRLILLVWFYSLSRNTIAYEAEK